MKGWLSYLCLLLLLPACRQEKTVMPEENAHFGPAISLEAISPDHSGVDFNNILHDGGNLNVFVWNFLYTGSGVATGDINNDGLPDIYFGGNQVSDRLYLNKGDFRFEDITVQAGIQGELWTTGVTMADVNGDGFLDIYVCKNSPTLDRDFNRNRLFINAGDLTFSEQAHAYGLADEGLSIQATFFDADQDGDPDMYLVNQPVDQLAQLIHPPDQVAAYPVTDRYFSNENGRFIDRTEEMELHEERYGLGISLGDYDGNGWTDIYVCNDYVHADLLYMNTGGKFRDELKERTGHISYYSMGSDAGDINNDGWEDVFVLDMAFEDHYRAKTNMESMQPELFWSLVENGQHYPYAQNTLQLNRGSGYFSEIAQIGGLSKSDWSWAALFVDLDSDGLQDILVTNGILRDMKNNDFTQWVKATYHGMVGPDNYHEVLAQLPSSPVSNKIYRNEGNLQFSDITKTTGFSRPGFSHGLAYADLDGDGDLDLVENNMNAVAGIYKNTSPGMQYLVVTLQGPGSNTHGLGSQVMVCAGGHCTVRTMQTSRGYYSACVPELYFGLGHAGVVDSVIITWNAREQTVLRDVEANQKLHIAYDASEKRAFVPRIPDVISLKDGVDLPFVHQEKAYDDYDGQVLLPYKLSQNGPWISRGDLNGDGIDDLFVGGAAGQPGAVLLGSADGKYVITTQPALDQDAAYEDQQAALCDLDSDGDPDLYVVSGSSEFPEGSPWLHDRVYLNDGNGNFRAKREALPDDVPVNGQCVEPLDFDQDGDPDLFVGGRQISGKYAVPALSRILVNDGGTLRDATRELAGEELWMGMVTDAVAADVDRDGDTDLFVVGEWMSPVILVTQNGRFTTHVLSEPGEGIWWTAEQIDFDQDGDPDFLLGNLGWNQKFGGIHPKLSVYAADFDENGDHDVVLAKKVGDTELPYRGRECSSEEMPFIASKFPTYDAFARAKLPEILGEEKLAESRHIQIRTLSSVLLRNDGDLKFTVMELPVQVQTGPVKAFEVQDFDGDGHVDFLYTGNHFPVEVETARYDGLIHGICFGDGRGGFRPRILASQEAPLMGDYRDVTCIAGTNGFEIIFAANDSPVVKYHLGHWPH